MQNLLPATLSKPLFACAIAVTGWIASAGVSPAAVVLDFYRITNNAALIPAGQLYAVVTDLSDINGPKVQFEFFNQADPGGLASTVTDIFVDNSSVLASLYAVIDIDTVDFDVDFKAVNAGPPTMPGANLAVPAFVGDPTLGAEAVHGGAGGANGIAAGIDENHDSVQLRYTLTSGKVFADVVNDLTNGSLRFGLHIQAIGGVTSDGYVSQYTPVPEPTTALVGFLLVACMLRRRRN
jgi:hypothetical protein